MSGPSEQSKCGWGGGIIATLLRFVRNQSKMFGLLLDPSPEIFGPPHGTIWVNNVSYQQLICYLPQSYVIHYIIMKKTAFKTEVFLTVPLTFLAFALVCVSLVTQQWVSGRGVYTSNSTSEENDGEITYNFGLFNGEKTRTRSGTKSYPLRSKSFLKFNNIQRLKFNHDTLAKFQL